MPDRALADGYRRTGHAHPAARRAFTLIEVLVVVVLLGILAAMVVPKMTSASDEARQSSLKMTINRVRTQIEIYYQQHGANYPALDTFEAQMTKATNLAGDTAEPGTTGYPFGAYLSRMPVNPNTSTSTVSAGEIGSSAWYYNQTTGEFRANDSQASAAF